jgi:hypothetical protein
MWIVQEVLQAYDLAFLAGSKVLQWKKAKSLFMTAKLIDEMIFGTEKVTNEAYRPYTADRIVWFFDKFIETPAAKIFKWKSVWDGQRQSLPLGEEPAQYLDRLMEDFAFQHCEDPRDRVFALLGLAKAAQQSDHGTATRLVS